MQIDLAYGRQGLSVSLPSKAAATIIRKPELAVADDAAGAIEAALAAPIGSRTLEHFAKGKRSACILICDITRPVPNALFLRPLIERLQHAGVPRSAITVVVATGLHRANEGAELAELVGDPWVLEHVKVENHFARDDAAHRSLGVTPTHGVPVSLDRRFLDADVKIATGLVEPHFMAGYSGGRKVVAPGIAHHETIRTLHTARFMEHPCATSCVVEGNPLHRAQLEILELIGEPVLAVNTVIDELRNLVYASFGEIVASHTEAVAFARRSCEVSTGRRFHTVVTSSAGYPLDKTYYQTVKGMVTPLDILSDGGTLIIASQCSEGIGSVEFRHAQQQLVAMGPNAFLQQLNTKSLADIDEWQTEMQLKPMRVGRVQLYAPELSDADRAITGVECVDDVTQAINAAMERHADCDVAVIPEGPYVVPFVSEAGATPR